MTYFEYTWGVILGVGIIIGVYSLIYLACRVIANSWRCIHRRFN